MSSSFITRIEQEKNEPYTVIFTTDDHDKYRRIVDECRMMIGHSKPTVDAVLVRHGRWISHGSYFVCSVCNEEQYGIDTGRYYCQNCGAKMDEVENGRV